MSFSAAVRDELAHVPTERPCCRAALLGAAARGAGALHLTGRGGLHATLDVQGNAVARGLVQVVREEGASCEIRTYREARFQRGSRVQVEIAGDEAGRHLLERAGVLDRSGRPCPRTPARVTSRSCCRSAFLRGALMVGGTVSAPTAAPALEIRTHDLVGAEEVARVAGADGCRLAVRVRGQRAEAYARRRETVGDILLLCDARDAALQYAEAEVMVLTRAAANRRANFDTANLRRQIVAARRQLEAIAALRAEGRLDTLDEELRRVAAAREAGPDLPLGELAQALGVPRPTVAGRLRRLVELGEIAAPAADRRTGL